MEEEVKEVEEGIGGRRCRGREWRREMMEEGSEERLREQ